MHIFAATQTLLCTSTRECGAPASLHLRMEGDAGRRGPFRSSRRASARRPYGAAAQRNCPPGWPRRAASRGIEGEVARPVAAARDSVVEAGEAVLVDLQPCHAVMAAVAGEQMRPARRELDRRAIIGAGRAGRSRRRHADGIEPPGTGVEGQADDGRVQLIDDIGAAPVGMERKMARTPRPGAAPPRHAGRRRRMSHRNDRRSVGRCRDRQPRGTGCPASSGRNGHARDPGAMHPVRCRCASPRRPGRPACRRAPRRSTISETPVSAAALRRGS